MDIIDTSVIRGMPAKDLFAIATKRRIVVSPFTIWEILCHLDEVKDGETPEQAYARRKGHVKLLQRIEILHDPFAQHASAVGAVALANPTRFEDREMAKHIVDRIVAAPSLPDVDKEVFIYASGATSSFKDIACRARAALVQEEQQYVNNVRKMWERIKNRSGVANPAQLKDDDLWKWLSAMVTALKQSYEADGVAADTLLMKVCDSMYAYYVYLLSRLCTYSNRPDGVLSIPVNDTEDGYICMHLRLLEDDVLVSGDGKTVHALQRALDLWNANVPKLPARCRVMGTNDYKKAFGT